MRLITTLICLSFVQLTSCQNRIQKIDSLITSLYDSGKFNGNVLIAEKGKKDNNTIVGKIKKDYFVLQRWEQVQSLKDIVKVEYMEV